MIVINGSNYIGFFPPLQKGPVLFLHSPYSLYLLLAYTHNTFLLAGVGKTMMIAADNERGRGNTLVFGAGGRGPIEY